MLNEAEALLATIVSAAANEMPHKRAKHSERVADKARRGKDLPPSHDVHFQSMPKGAMRIIQGAHIQAEYREKKKQREEEQATKLKKRALEGDSLKIREGEKMGEFHRRVESTMAKGIQSSIKATRDSTKKRKRKAGEEDDEGGQDAPLKGTKSGRTAVHVLDGKALKKERETLERRVAGPIDFQKAETRKRVNDVVLAPPVLTRAPRGESKQAKERKAKLQSLMTGREASATTPQPPRLPDPVQQKGGLKREAMLQQERNRVVQAYRDKKQADLRSSR